MILSDWYDLPREGDPEHYIVHSLAIQSSVEVQTHKRPTVEHFEKESYPDKQTPKIRRKKMDNQIGRANLLKPDV